MCSCEADVRRSGAPLKGPFTLCPKSIVESQATAMYSNICSDKSI